jgi:hypothetical protein
LQRITRRYQSLQSLAHARSLILEAEARLYERTAPAKLRGSPKEPARRSISGAHLFEMDATVWRTFFSCISHDASVPVGAVEPNAAWKYWLA